MDEISYIEILGGVRATSGERTITRFPMRQMGGLLASLADHWHRAHPRELLIEQLWPSSYAGEFGSAAGQ